MCRDKTHELKYSILCTPRLALTRATPGQPWHGILLGFDGHALGGVGGETVGGLNFAEVLQKLDLGVRGSTIVEWHTGQSGFWFCLLQAFLGVQKRKT